MVNLSNITGKLTKNADLIGTLLGASARGIDPLIDNIQRLFTGEGHVPDIAATIKEFTALPEIRPTIMMYLAGYVAKEAGFSKYGNPIMKLSEGMFKGLAIQHLLYHSTHGGEGSAGNPTGDRSLQTSRGLYNY